MSPTMLASMKLSAFRTICFWWSELNTFACGGIAILGVALELRGGNGFAQDITLVAFCVEVCVPLGYLSRGLARSLKCCLQ